MTPASAPSGFVPRRLLRVVTTHAAVLGMLAAGFGPGADTAAAATRKKVFRLAPGLTLTTITYAGGPLRVRVLTITDPADHPVSLDAGNPDASYPGYALTSTMGTNYGALAAVNGDYDSGDGRPVHVSAEDGIFRSSGLSTGVGFSMTADELRGYAKRPGQKVRAEVADNPDVGRFEVESWNARQAGGGRIAGFTSTGGSVERPGTDTCWVRLFPAGGAAGNRRWAPERRGIRRTYVVERQPENPCPFEAPNVGDTQGAVIIAAQRGTPKASMLEALEAGDEVSLTWTAGWRGVSDLVGGAPQLLADPDGDGDPRIVAPESCGSYFCNRNPRTGVGINQACVRGRNGCKVFIITVDGRRSNWSIGVDLPRFAKEFERRGAVFAINFDGGGSTTMWVSDRGSYCQLRRDVGCLVNRPAVTSGTERSRVSALLVMPRGEAAFRPTRMPQPATGIEEPPGVEPGSAALTDPGSTGGLLEAFGSGRRGAVG